jgi:hypothetical protein
MTWLTASGMAWGWMFLGEDLPGFPPTGTALCPTFHRSTSDTGNPEVVNVRTIDVADIADVIFLTKATMHTRMVADDNIVIDERDPRSSHAAYHNVIVRGYAVLERRTTDGRVVVSAPIP